MSYWDDLKNLIQTSGKDAVKGAFAGSPLADIINNAPDLFNEAATSPTGQAVANGLTGAPLTDLVPNPGNPVSGAAEGLIAPTAEDAATPDAPPAPAPKMPPTTPPPADSAEEDSAASAAPAAPSAPSTDAATPPAKDKSPLEALLAQPDNDNQKRLANQAALEKRRKLDIIPEALATFADGIAGAGTAFGANIAQDAGKEQKEADKTDIDTQKKQFEENLKNDPNSDISKQYQGLLAKFLQKDPSDPMLQGRSASQIAGQIPAIEKLANMQNQKDMKELQTQALKNQRDIGLSQKHDTEQARIENAAIQRLSSLRGDKSLQDAEAKRDAAITVYNTIDNLQKKGEMPSKLVYYDLLGQMWKARTGASPTDKAIQDLDQKTFKGNLGKAVTFFTGKASPATTAGVLQNIKDFAQESGQQADQFHEGYMKAHLIKPKDLEDSRWAPIANTARGNSFADATKQSQKASAPVVKQIGGKNYVQHNGKWYVQ